MSAPEMDENPEQPGQTNPDSSNPNENTEEESPGFFARLALDLYDKVVNGGIPGLCSADELANSYRTGYASTEDAAKALVRWQNGKCAADGFLTSLPGLAFLPATLSANVVSILAFNIQTVAAVARLGEYDLHDECIKSLVLICIAGESVNVVFRQLGIDLTKVVLVAVIKSIPRALLGKINRLVGVKLLTKFSAKGFIQLGRLVPLVGGLVGGGCDYYWSSVVGEKAIETFIRKPCPADDVINHIQRSAEETEQQDQRGSTTGPEGAPETEATIETEEDPTSKKDV